MCPQSGALLAAPRPQLPLASTSSDMEQILSSLPLITTRAPDR